MASAGPQDPGAHPWVSPGTLPWQHLAGSGREGVWVPLTWAASSLGCGVTWEECSAALTELLLISWFSLLLLTALFLGNRSKHLLKTVFFSNFTLQTKLW